MTFETLTVRRDAAVLVAEIAAPPMNLLGPKLVRDLVSLIQQAEADDTIRVVVLTSADPDYFGARERHRAGGGGGRPPRFRIEFLEAGVDACSIAFG